MQKYNIALLWLIQSKYDVKAVLIGKTDVKVELWEDNKLLKSDTIPFDTSFVRKVHAKIIKLHEHFTNQITN